MSVVLDRLCGARSSRASKQRVLLVGAVPASVEHAFRRLAASIERAEVPGARLVDVGFVVAWAAGAGESDAVEVAGRALAVGHYGVVVADHEASRAVWKRIGPAGLETIKERVDGSFVAFEVQKRLRMELPGGVLPVLPAGVPVALDIFITDTPRTAAEQDAIRVAAEPVSSPHAPRLLQLVSEALPASAEVTWDTVQPVDIKPTALSDFMGVLIAPASVEADWQPATLQVAPLVATPYFVQPETLPTPEPEPERPHLRIVGAKPTVLILTDVMTWAWQRKAEQLKRYLSDEFEIDIWPTVVRGQALPQRCDIYHTFDFKQADYVDFRCRLLTGITAHVWRTWGDAQVRRWARRAVGVHANSRLLEAEMRCPDGAAAFHERVYYVPNGVDPEMFRRTRPRAVNDRLIVGHVGKPNPRKGAHLVEAACVRAGVELRQINVRADQARSAEAMCEFYQDLHVLCVASDMDGTPNPALEAAACEVALVSNIIGNMPEFFEGGPCGVLVERSIEGIETALSVLRFDLPLAEALGRTARATVLREWTWERQAENYRVMWREALTQEARR